jgi:hypothetical protein
MSLPDEVLSAWQAYFAVEPWKEDRADLRSALQSAHLHHSMTGEKVSIDKFLPVWDPTPVDEGKELEQAVAVCMALSEEE